MLSFWFLVTAQKKPTAATAVYVFLRSLPFDRFQFSFQFLFFFLYAAVLIFFFLFIVVVAAAAAIEFVSMRACVFFLLFFLQIFAHAFWFVNVEKHKEKNVYSIYYMNKKHQIKWMEKIHNDVYWLYL